MSIVQDNYKLAKSLTENLPEKGISIGNVKRNRELKKTLNDIADLLPATAYTSRVTTNETVLHTRNQEIKNRAVVDPNNIQPMIDIAKEKDGVFSHKVEDIKYNRRNNRRAVFKAWKEKGKNGVIEYLLYISTNNAKINSFDKTYREVKIAKKLAMFTAQGTLSIDSYLNK